MSLQIERVDRQELVSSTSEVQASNMQGQSMARETSAGHLHRSSKGWDGVFPVPWEYDIG